ncbi:MAG: hypothetical protein KDB53_02790, partial [Planctomycetes bacterium]|nr:hypothetical protein [Planctomycetota bacterium]
MTDIKHDPPKDEPEDDDQPTTAGRPRSQEERDAILERETVVDRKLRARRDSGAERPVSQSTAGRRGTSSRALKLPPVELPDDAPHTLGRYR